MAASAGELDALQALLRSGVSVNRLNDVRAPRRAPCVCLRTTPAADAAAAQEGRTALHTACAFGHTAIVDALLKHGADIRLKDGARPLARDATATEHVHACQLVPG